MLIRNRIKEIRQVRAGDLAPNPKNWRVHTDAQRAALQGILAEVGYVDALLARELPDGTLQLLDGHLRAETTPDVEVPVLITDLDEREAALVLATFDPLAAMATASGEKLEELLRDVSTGNEALQELLDQLAQDAGIVPGDKFERSEEVVDPRFEVVVTVATEEQQRELFERLTKEGLACRVLTL